MCSVSVSVSLSLSRSCSRLLYDIISSVNVDMLCMHFATHVPAPRLPTPHAAFICFAMISHLGLYCYTFVHLCSCLCLHLCPKVTLNLDLTYNKLVDICFVHVPNSVTVMMLIFSIHCLTLWRETFDLESGTLPFLHRFSCDSWAQPYTPMLLYDTTHLSVHHRAQRAHRFIKRVRFCPGCAQTGPVCSLTRLLLPRCQAKRGGGYEGMAQAPW